MNSAQEPGVAGKGCGDCAVEKVLTEGLCKQEFLVSSSVYMRLFAFVVLPS